MTTEPASEEYQLKSLTLATEWLATVIELNTSTEDGLPLDIRQGMATVYVDHIAKTEGVPPEEVVRGLCIIIQGMCVDIGLDPQQLVNNLRKLVKEKRGIEE